MHEEANQESILFSICVVVLLLVVIVLVVLFYEYAIALAPSEGHEYTDFKTLNYVPEKYLDTTQLTRSGNIPLERKFPLDSLYLNQ